MTNAVVFGTDLDGTAILSFEAPPGGVGVPAAYEQAITDIWGKIVWNSLGGFVNQAPIEIVQKLIERNDRSSIVSGAQSYHHKHEDCLASVMPVEDGTRIKWGSGDRSELLLSAVEVLVRRKLQLLLPNIGKEISEGGAWPRLTPGFAEVWRGLSSNPVVVTAIVTSGHDEFVRQVFDLHELPQPDVLVSDDLMRRSGRQIYKPDIALWECVLRAVREQGRQPHSSWYVGDDRVNDGGLAQSAMISFRHFTGEGSVWRGHEGTFDDWTQVSEWSDLWRQ